jgi:hypothetical protein
MTIKILQLSTNNLAARSGSGSSYRTYDMETECKKKAARKHWVIVGDFSSVERFDARTSERKNDATARHTELLPRGFTGLVPGRPG